jgi:hypothetical protein
MLVRDKGEVLVARFVTFALIHERGEGFETG